MSTRLPARRAAAPADYLEPSGLAGLRVLVFEDAPGVGELALRLAELGARVARADLAFLDAGGWRELGDVIVCDIARRGTDVVAVTRRVRSCRPATPLVVACPEPSVETEADALDAGADDVLVHPVPTVRLRARLQRAVRGAAARSATISVGDLEVDFARVRASVRGERLDLTQLEYTILAHLAAERGRTVPRAALIARVWGTRRVTPNALDRMVGRLRRKLETAGAAATIRTVWAHGFALAPADA